MNKYVKLIVFLILTMLRISGQVNQFPQIYYNGQGIGGANLNVRTAPSLGSGIETSLLGFWQIGAVNEEISSEQQGYASWARVCLPTINGQIKYGYILYGEYNARISAVNTNAIVNASNLFIREGPGTNYPIVKISGQNATYSQNSIVALTGNANGVWYEVYLPNNCNIASKKGWLSSENNYLTINSNIFNYYNIAGRVTNVGNVSIWGADTYFGSIGSANSTEGFYQYKLPIGWTGIVTCEHPNYNYSNPTSYNHIANGHIYNRDFVLLNTPPSCINWASGPHSNPDVVTAMEYLCQNGYIEQNQDANNLIDLQLQASATYIYNAIYHWGNNAPSHNFPTPFIDIEKLTNVAPYYYQDAVKCLLYLDYQDGIPPFSRDYFYVGGIDQITKGRCIRAVLEAFHHNLNSNDYIGYDKNDNSPSDFNCQVNRNDPNYPWLKKAHSMGLMNGLLKNCNNCTANVCFKQANNPPYLMDKWEFFILLYNTIKNYGIPTIQTSDYFTPNNITCTNSNTKLGLNRGVFNSYENNIISIPGGGLPLNFSIAYHSNLTELPFISNEFQNYYSQLEKVYPFGVGWTHSYNIYIQGIRKDINQLGVFDKLQVYWADGTFDIYDYTNKNYETKSVYDVFTVDEYDIIYGTQNPNKISIKQKDGTIYKFQRNLQLLTNYFLTEIVDRNGNKLIFTYYGNNINLASIEDPVSKRSISITYKNNTNLIEKVIDNSLQRTYQFNVNTITYNLDSYIDSKGQITNYTYGNSGSENHLLKQIKLPKGNVITNTYFNRKLKSSENNQYSVKVEWSQNYFNGGNTSSTITASQNGQNYTSSVANDSRGNIVTIKDPTGSSAKIEYNDPNNPDLPTLVKDSATNISYQFSYDNKGNLISKTKSINQFNQNEKYTYNNFSQVISYTDPKGNISSNLYSVNGDLISSTDALGNTTNYLNNSNGNPTQITNPSGITTNYNYNSYGNVDTIKILNTSIKAWAKYDDASRVTITSDPKGIKDYFYYDNNDNIQSKIYDQTGLNLPTTYEYDANDNLIKITDPKNISTILDYDYYTDDLILELYGGATKKWTYNSDGTFKSSTNKLGYIFNYAYAPQGDPFAGKILSDGYSNYNYYSGSKLLKSVFHNAQTIEYTYDELLRTKNIDYKESSGTISVAYEYDNNNNILGIKYPIVNKSVFYEYDNLNRLINIKDWKNRNLVTYSYLYDSRLNTETYGNGTSTKYAYDNAGRLLSIITKNSSGDTLVASIATLDLNGNHTSEVIYNKFNDTIIQNFPINSLQNYNYDSGNNQLLNINGTNNISFTNDIQGRVRNINGNTKAIQIDWDEKDRLTKYLDNNGPTINFQYDPYGNRRKQNDTKYVLDILNGSNVLEETTLNGTVKSIYVHGLGLVCRIDPLTDEISYYHSDFRGSTLAITNSLQNKTHQYQYDPFGKVDRISTSGFNNPFQFVGKYGIMYDESGLYYMRARYYNPELGRFLSEDPVWGTNLFAYAENNPVMNIDPTGACPICLLVGFEIIEYAAIALEVYGTASLGKDIYNGNYEDAGAYISVLNIGGDPFIKRLANGEKNAIRNTVKNITKNTVKSGINSVEDLIARGTKMTNIKGGSQISVKGSIDEIFNSLGIGGEKITLPNGQLQIRLSNGTTITKYSAGSGSPTLQINRKGTITKVRINK